MAGIPRTLPELVKKAIAGAMQDVHVALPGTVQRWDATANLADVQVAVKHPLFDDDNGRTFEDMGVLLGVPVMWPRAGGFILTMPLTAGDSGLLIFNSTAIGEWRSSGQTSSPTDASRHSVGWPVFVPGLFPDLSPPAVGDLTPRGAGVVLGKDGANAQLRIDGTHVDVGAGATDFVALASLVKALFDQLHSDFSGWTVVPNDGGAALKAKLSAGFLTLSTAVAATIARAK